MYQRLVPENSLCLNCVIYYIVFILLLCDVCYVYYGNVYLLSVSCFLAVYVVFNQSTSRIELDILSKKFRIAIGACDMRETIVPSFGDLIHKYYQCPTRRRSGFVVLRHGNSAICKLKFRNVSFV